MKISRARFRNRAAWTLDNDTLSLTVLAGGGHLAGLALRGYEQVNPFWSPPWPAHEPWAFSPAVARQCGTRLLAGIAGHNVCLGWFGDPSPEETRAGMGCHGEAPIVRWKLVRQQVTGTGVTLVCACELPVAQMRLTRTIAARRDECAIRVHEEVQNLSRRDLPYTHCQHVTIGPPFLEKGVTTIDMSATQGHTFPEVFSPAQRLKMDAPFTWPMGPGAHGEDVDLRRIDRRYRHSSDFTTQLMDPRREHAWVSALNPRLGLLLAYVWRRADYPWLGNWEENHARHTVPWAGRTLARGLEFANTPFPQGLQNAVNRGRFQGQPTFRWLPARGKVATDYTILLMPVPKDATGVVDIQSAPGGLTVDLRGQRP
ncbi:MAG: hypothetical protein K8T26_14445 [Lentisphaerae bacterium]|nr:hypothetical protein [Lentisphaerota bacterium]